MSVNKKPIDQVSLVKSSMQSQPVSSGSQAAVVPNGTKDHTSPSRASGKAGSMTVKTDGSKIVLDPNSSGDDAAIKGRPTISKPVENGCLTSEEHVSMLPAFDKLAGLPISTMSSLPVCDTGRKSSFQITSVIPKEVKDDADETHTADDGNSATHDLSRITDQTATDVPSSADTVHTPDDEIQWPNSPHVPVQAMPVLSPSSIHDDVHSRFRIVKIESRDRWHRGRWTCHDFADPSESNSSEHVDASNTATVNSQPIIYIPYKPSQPNDSSKTTETYKSPVGIVYCNSGGQALEPSLLTSPLYPRGVPFFSQASDSGVSSATLHSTNVASSVSSMGMAQISESTNGAVIPPSDERVLVGSVAIRQLFVGDTEVAGRETLTASASDPSLDRQSQIGQQLAAQPMSASIIAGSTSDAILQPIIGAPSSLDTTAPLLTAVGPINASQAMLPVAGSSSNLLLRTNSQILPLDAMMSNLATDNDANGTGTVAIDNKIEQAMDLVKSHLMFAVREEVDLLKERIKELIERNNMLEYENKFLRERATPETLAKLQHSKPQ